MVGTSRCNSKREGCTLLLLHFLHCIVPCIPLRDSGSSPRMSCFFPYKAIHQILLLLQKLQNKTWQDHATTSVKKFKLGWVLVHGYLNKTMRGGSRNNLIRANPCSQYHQGGLACAIRRTIILKFFFHSKNSPNPNHFIASWVKLYK